MIKITLKSFINTLFNIISSSPSSIIFIIVGIIFTVAMIINLIKKKTIGKSLYITGWLFIVIFIIVKYNSYISKIFDNLINQVFMQIFFPNLATYIIIIALTNIIFLYTIIKKTTKSTKIINTLFFSIIMLFMVYTLEQIISGGINIYEQKEIYTNQNILTLIESTTIIFSFWVLIITSKHIIKKLIKKSNDKIKKEYENSELKPIQNNKTTIKNEESIIPTTNNIDNQVINPIIKENEESIIPITSNIENQIIDPKVNKQIEINHIKENKPIKIVKPIPFNSIKKTKKKVQPIPFNSIKKNKKKIEPIPFNSIKKIDEENIETLTL